MTLTSQGLTFFLRIVSTMILARLLAPEDFGMISMVAAITGFAKIFSDLGLSTATIQREDITHAQVSSLFWINAALGLLITILIAALSPAVARFYMHPQLNWVTVALSLNFVITGLAIQHKALLIRQMRFFTVAKVQVWSILLGIIVAVFMAMNGFRYWALVLNTLVTSAAGVVGFWWASGWRPSLPPRKSGVRSLLNFGLDVAGFNIINYFSQNLDNILIGRYYGSAALGIYSKAYQLLMLPITNLRIPLNKVAMPALSRLRPEPEKYRSYYMKFISALAFVSMPFVAFMFVCSDNIIRVVLGAQWMEASGLFKILAVAGLIKPVVSTYSVVALSSDQSRRYFWCGGANAVGLMLSFIVGLPWGAKGVATAYVVANYLLLCPTLIFIFKGTPIRFGDFLRAILKPLTGCLAMGAAIYPLQLALSDIADIGALTILFSACLPVYILVITILPGGTRDLRTYYRYGRLVFTDK